MLGIFPWLHIALLKVVIKIFIKPDVGCLPDQRASMALTNQHCFTQNHRQSCFLLPADGSEREIRDFSKPSSINWAHKEDNRPVRDAWLGFALHCAPFNPQHIKEWFYMVTKTSMLSADSLSKSALI